MKFRDGLAMVWRSLLGNISKSLLTASGIAIGIAAVTLLTALGEGMRGYVLNQFSQFGTNIIAVTPGKEVTHGIGGLLSSVRLLTLEDADAMRTVPGVEHVVPVVQGVGEIEFGNRKRSSDILGVSADMPEAWRFRVVLGRFLPADESGRSRNYAVLGHTMKRELFGSSNPLGQNIRVGGMRFRVLGVIEEKGQMLGFDIDDLVYVPVDKALQLFNREGLMEIDVTFAETANSTKVAEHLKTRLIERHGEEDFTLSTQDEMLDTMGNVMSVLTLGVVALGSISLFVGAVGIATIMTTVVKERTEEIGLLRAVGSSQRTILAIFLGEAIVVSVLGGAMGLALVALTLFGIKLALPSLPATLDPWFMMLALIVSAVIGLLAGLAPALSAARLNPIEALHSE